MCVLCNTLICFDNVVPLSVVLGKTRVFNENIMPLQSKNYRNSCLVIRKHPMADSSEISSC